MIAIHTLTSALHDEAAVAAVTREFLDSLNVDFVLKGAGYEDYGSADLDLIYVRTGGTEGVFKPLLPKLLAATRQPVYLLTSGKSNSLAASMEILSYLRQQGIKGEILHGSPRYIASRIRTLEQIEKARKQLQGLRLGVVGKPSDWLISSGVDYAKVRDASGIELVDIPMEELLSVIGKYPEDETAARIACGQPLFDAAQKVKDAAPGAHRIYLALRDLVGTYRLGGLTLRCFDLLGTVKNTGCLALARLNAEGIVATCEGDIPAMLSMVIGRALTGVSGFQANPSRIDPETGEVLFAHCTIPLDMVTRYAFDTHFESGIGMGIRGHMQEGPVTVFKVSGDFSRHFAEEGTLLRNQSQPDLCRTQVVLRLPQTDYFLKNPIGNHHIILPGHVKALLDALLA